MAGGKNIDGSLRELASSSQKCLCFATSVAPGSASMCTPKHASSHRTSTCTSRSRGAQRPCGSVAHEARVEDLLELLFGSWGLGPGERQKMGPCAGCLVCLRCLEPEPEV